MDLQSRFGSTTQAIKSVLKGLTDEMQMCIFNCTQCHQVCEQMIQHCLKKGGLHAEFRHMGALKDCADICALSADFMLRGSDLHERICSVCADVCLKCAADCERIN